MENFQKPKLKKKGPKVSKELINIGERESVLVVLTCAAYKATLERKIDWWPQNEGIQVGDNINIFIIPGERSTAQITNILTESEAASKRGCSMQINLCTEDEKIFEHLLSKGGRYGWYEIKTKSKKKF